MTRTMSLEDRRARLGPPLRIDGRRPIRTRPRDPDETEALVQMALASKRQWVESGRLVKLGPRRYEYHLVSLREDDE